MHLSVGDTIELSTHSFLFRAFSIHNTMGSVLSSSSVAVPSTSPPENTSEDHVPPSSFSHVSTSENMLHLSRLLLDTPLLLMFGGGESHTFVNEVKQHLSGLARFGFISLIVYVLCDHDHASLACSTACPIPPPSLLRSLLNLKFRESSDFLIAV